MNNSVLFANVVNELSTPERIVFINECNAAGVRISMSDIADGLVRGSGASISATIQERDGGYKDGHYLQVAKELVRQMNKAAEITAESLGLGDGWVQG